jgi:hypothetical protein
MKDQRKRLYEVFERVNKIKLKEWYDDEYHQKPVYPKGMGDFLNIDWKTLYETLQINYGVVTNKPGYEKSIAYNYGDLTDDEGMLSPQELQHLEAFGLVEKMGAFPVIGGDFGDYESFYNKAKEIWNKEVPTQSTGGDSEAPFLRGREPES